MARPINPKPGEGRKTRTVEHATATQILEGAVIPAAKLLRDLISGTRKRISQQRYSAAVFNIEQCLGKARQKIEHSGGILTYNDIVKDAEKLEKKPRDILADAEEIANKHKEAPSIVSTVEGAPDTSEGVQ